MTWTYTYNRLKICPKKNPNERRGRQRLQWRVGADEDAKKIGASTWKDVPEIGESAGTLRAVELIKLNDCAESEIFSESFSGFPCRLRISV